MKFTRAVDIRYICLHKEIALPNALKLNFAQLSPARFSEFEGENSVPVDAFFLRTFSDEKLIF